MKRRYMIAAQMTTESEKELIAFFRKNKLGWWHRVPNFWLVVDSNDKVDVSSIRDALKGKAKLTSLVMEINEDITWAGLHQAPSDSFDWLKSTWVDKAE
jgi:hypothetical protein